MLARFVEKEKLQKTEVQIVKVAIRLRDGGGNRSMQRRRNENQIGRKE